MTLRYPPASMRIGRLLPPLIPIVFRRKLLKDPPPAAGSTAPTWNRTQEAERRVRQRQRLEAKP
jgi:hypothetical protein